jgi:hypothetical protein
LGDEIPDVVHHSARVTSFLHHGEQNLADQHNRSRDRGFNVQPLRDLVEELRPLRRNRLGRREKLGQSSKLTLLKPQQSLNVGQCSSREYQVVGHGDEKSPSKSALQSVSWC